MKFFMHSVVATIVILGAIFALDAIPFNLGFLDPIEQALKDFQLTDIVFSRLTTNRPLRIDTNIVIVNVAEYPRVEIAKALRVIRVQNPKVIGFDVIYKDKADSLGLDSLVDEINCCPQIVLAERADFGTDSNGNVSVESFELSIDKLRVPRSSYGVVNFSDEGEGFRTIRTFHPGYVLQDTSHTQFSVAVASCFDSSGTRELTSRGNEMEVINYQRARTYTRLDAEALVKDAVSIDVRGKIVLFGFVGRSFLDSSGNEDKFFSPMNERYAGKTLPDVYGTEIHANIISMVLHKDYISQMGGTGTMLITFILCLLNVMLFAYVEDSNPYFYDLITKTTQVMESIGLLWFTVWLFNIFRYKIDLTFGIAAVILSADIYSIYISAVEAFQNKYIHHKKPTS